MLILLLRRLLWSIPLLVIVTGLTFLLSALAPGDLARSMLGGEGTQEQYLALREQLGLDLPLWEQYWRWMAAALQGDLGTSVYTGEPVIDLLTTRVGVTISLMVGVLLLCLTIGVALGIFSALRGGVLGRFVDVVSMGGLVLPSFWVALMLISVFAVQLRWFPATGYTFPEVSVGGWLLGLVLPVAAVSLHGITTVAKQTRDSMSEVMSRDFIRALRASGVSTGSIVFKHALRNASLPVVTVIGIVMVTAIGGTVFVERVFVLPGLGSLAVEATLQNNIPLLQGVALYFTIITIVINVAVDLSYGWLNPKARVS